MMVREELETSERKETVKSSLGVSLAIVLCAVSAVCAQEVDVADLWAKSNVFDSFLIRPMFVCHGQETVYSTEVQRDTYFALTDDELAEVKQVKVRFVK